MLETFETVAKAVADPNRVRILKLLESGELCVCQITAVLDLAAATVSKHLSLLKAAGLLQQRREGKWAYYRLAERALNPYAPAFLGLIGATLADDPTLTEDARILGKVNALPLQVLCDQGRAALDLTRPTSPASSCCGTPMMTETSFNVLFLCTGNSARSILAESILNREGAGKFRAYSAGSHPKGGIDPTVLALLKKTNHPTEALRSKSWDEFTGADAPTMDFVFTVCDNAAGEVCPIWPGQPMTAHWGVPDPAGFVGSEAEKAAFCGEVMRLLRTRISIFAALPIASLDRLSLQRRLKEIGKVALESPEARDSGVL
ncbi:ArsR family transcriptional regulator [Rhodospirillum rubrum]|uniref:metalloregulator ArsR/SmtB family transcription factor n=2 Tax=Rhodospirillum rubrum TaxID=1085 RepID=UPI0019045526|nr:metalloregulator ArsR/SmtB family transcription factor [Rhodospirillum rubrum]MBK1665241.1 ArsR family transcriptional regulator [Rhodospirillum rubrum]MBK1677560.1 ArsR family transcriptional regulator [Rhodospirillum rubrum]